MTILFPSSFFIFSPSSQCSERVKRFHNQSGKGEKYLSNVIREALTEYISAYTGEPTLKGLERRINEIEIRLKKIEDILLKDVGEMNRVAK